MNGPLRLTNPNPTVLDALIAGEDPLNQEDLPRYRALATETQPLRLRRIAEEEAAASEERLLAETKSEVTRLSSQLTAELQKTRITNWDEAISNPASDTRALSEQLRPLEDHVRFTGDVGDRLGVRINAARVTRLTATVAKCKVDAYEAQLLCAISLLTIEAAMAPIRAAEGGILVFGQRTQALKRASEEKHRLVALAEAALREEVNRQLIAEQTRMASGTITRAQVASAIG